MCQAYRRQYGFDAISVMPTNLYGPQRQLRSARLAVLPALIRRFIEAQESKAPTVTMWGSGKPRREFLHADDFAEAVCMLMETYSSEELVNIGCGEDVSIAELAAEVAKAAGYEGRSCSTPRSRMARQESCSIVSRLTALGWKPRIGLAQGIAQTCEWYRQNVATARR